MGYSDQFKAFREARGLSREQLAASAGCHRNTVINVESGRPVKFTTIVRLMGKMGYSESSAETKLLALLWLETVSGVKVTRGEVALLPTGVKAEQAALHELHVEVIQQALEPADISLLQWIARNRQILNSIRAIRDFFSKTGPSLGNRTESA
jgi:transcriptional regulator with XRE-family HTH domain